MHPSKGVDAQLRIAAKALNRVLAFNRRHAEVRDCLPESGLLYHYTTVAGLKGIIENNEVWASSAYFLNDSAEVLYGYEVIVEVLDAWLNAPCTAGAHRMSSEAAEHLKEKFLSDLVGDRSKPVYLACFCEDGNLLSQWRAYGPSGGYAIGFRVSLPDPRRMLTPEPKVHTARLIKVEYSRCDQVRRCREILNGVLPILDEPGVAEAIRIARWSTLSFEGFVESIGEMLLEETLSFKSKAFAVEQEWRMVVRPRKLLKQGNDDGGRTPIPIHFRVTDKYAIPYVRLIPKGDDQKLPINSIRSGPTLDRSIAELSIRQLLSKHNFVGVLLEYSDISARC